MLKSKLEVIFGLIFFVFSKTSPYLCGEIIIMNRREELIELSGQVINGMMSADGSIISKVVDRAFHKCIAEAAVGIALSMMKEIDKHY